VKFGEQSGPPEIAPSVAQRAPFGLRAHLGRRLMLRRTFFIPAGLASVSVAATIVLRGHFTQSAANVSALVALGLLVAGCAREKEPAIMTTFANDLAEPIARGAHPPYPYGSVIVMEFANSVRDGEGQPLRDAKGALVKGDIARIDVMRRERGFGAGYGEQRAGEWEFASYRPDGSLLMAPANSANCAACHRNAGAEKDFVFHSRP